LFQFSAEREPGNEIPDWRKSFRRVVEFIGGQRKALAGWGTAILLTEGSNEGFRT
jgi:hypothetical protein